MSLRAELETWDSAIKAYDAEDFEKSLDLFGRIADSSKILTNMGLIYATLGEHETAVEQFREATKLDQYLAVAYFQCGVSNFLLGRYDLAFKDFEDALLYLRGNQAINYEQLGLKFRLYSAEVLFNKGLCLVYMGQDQDGLTDMREAQKEKATEEHNVIDEAIADNGVGYTVFSIPVGILYRPPENKMKNAKPKDYLGKAKLVAAENPQDAYTTFTGVTRLQQGYGPMGAPIEKPAPDLAPPRATVERAASTAARLERQNTTLQVREGASLQKAATIGAKPFSNGPQGASSPPSLTKGPVRGLSVRRAGDGPPPPEKRGVNGEGAGPKNSRLTEIYDDYMDQYGEEPPIPGQDDGGRVRNWASKTTPGAPIPPSRSVSTRIANSTYGGSLGSMRRRPTRRNTYARSRAASQYDEDEENGYGSGDFDDGPFELTMIRVKIHYRDEVRGMALSPETPYEEFLDRVCSKFNKNFGDVKIKFTDEDGSKVTLRDETDYDLAIETARESAKGKPDGKLVVYVED